MAVEWEADQGWLCACRWEGGSKGLGLSWGHSLHICWFVLSEHEKEVQYYTEKGKACSQVALSLVEVCEKVSEC